MKAKKQLVTLCVLALALLLPNVAQADFGLQSYGFTMTNEDGTTDFQAGSHPYEAKLEFEMNLDAKGNPEGKLRDLIVNLPAGMVGNPTAVPRCSGAAFEGVLPHCPGDTQIGRIVVHISGDITAESPIYNLTPAHGVAASLGTSIANNNSFQEATLRSDGDFGIDVSDITIPTEVPIVSITETIWGIPAAAGHDAERQCFDPGNPNAAITGCASNLTPTPYLSLPSSCGEALETTLHVDSVEEPGVFDSLTAITEEGGEAAGMSGCNQLEFKPTIASQPTTTLADSPSGLDFDLHVPQPPVVNQEAGRTDVCSIGAWSGNPSEFSISWLRNGVPIEGETSLIHEVSPEDASTSLQCEVLAENGSAGPGHALSPPLAIPPAPAIAPPTRGKPSVTLSATGIPNCDLTNECFIATCDPGTWGGEAALSYRWLKDGAIVEGQTESSYELGKAPFTLQCEVIGSNPGGTVAAYSANEATGNPAPTIALPDSTRAPQLQLNPDELPLASAHLKDTTVTLPEGLAINPAAANGLGSCSQAQIGYQPKAGQIHFSKQPQSCPDAAKLGTLEVTTPLLSHKLPGAIYIAEPYRNPFGTLTAIYLVVEDPESGTIAKLAGKIVPDPATGRLTTTFDENPQLPLEDVALHFFKGPRSTLKTPLTCGKYTTTSTLVPWSTPEGETVHPSDSFLTSVAAGGSGACPTTEAQAPNKPTFTAGTVAPQAGAYTPFVLKLSRQDGSQRIKTIDTTLPPGLTGKLAGVPYCPEAAIAQAISREAPNQGVAEQQHPSCPAASEVGTATVGAGAGVTPFYTTAHAYLAGPYKGAPLSMAIVASAVAGPFDLGAVVVRTPFYVNSETAQIHAVSDPLPSIIAGIPLDIRSIALKLDRPSFTLNPTSCDPMQVLGSTTSTLGSPASLENPFQVGGCKALKFSPKLNISLKGGTKRGRFPALRAILTYPKGSGYANTASAQVTLPHGEFIEQAHFKTICTNVQFKASACPPGAIYGKARAFTPLLDNPVEGPVYLRSSTHQLPDLVISLKGQVDADLVGKVDTGSNGGLRTTFESAPDVPVSKVILEMQGGKKGLLVNSENICRKPQRAIADFTAQNGKVSETKPLVKNSCKGKAKKAKRGRKGGKANGGKR